MRGQDSYRPVVKNTFIDVDPGGGDYAPKENRRASDSRVDYMTAAAQRLQQAEAASAQAAEEASRRVPLGSPKRIPLSKGSSRSGGKGRSSIGKGGGKQDGGGKTRRGSKNNSAQATQYANLNAAMPPHGQMWPGGMDPSAVMPMQPMVGAPGQMYHPQWGMVPSPYMQMPGMPPMSMPPGGMPPMSMPPGGYGMPPMGVPGMPFEQQQPAQEEQEESEEEDEDEQEVVKTTVMLRNLPPEYTRDMVMGLLDRRGFLNQYDFVYMPMNLRTNASFGYIFVNLISEEIAERCRSTFQGSSDWDVPSDKACDVLWSAEQQGQEENIARYRDSPVMHDSVPEHCKPVLLKNGVRIEFPLPTKRLREPRVRRPQAKGTAAPPGTTAAAGAAPAANAATPGRQ